MSTPTELWAIGSGDPPSLIAGSALNALANNGLVAGSAFDNTSAADASGKGMTLCDVELLLDSFGSAVTANTAFSLWFLVSQDGTNYEDGSSSVTPARAPDVTFPLRAVSTTQRIIRRTLVPWGKFTPLLKNDGSGQALASNNNSSLKIRRVTVQLPSV